LAGKNEVEEDQDKVFLTSLFKKDTTPVIQAKEIKGVNELVPNTTFNGVSSSFAGVNQHDTQSADQKSTTEKVFSIFVKLKTRVRIKVHGKTSMQEVKEKIQDKLGFAPSQCYLTCNGRPFEKGQVIDDFHLRMDDKIVCTVRGKGGARDEGSAKKKRKILHSKVSSPLNSSFSSSHAQQTPVIAAGAELLRHMHQTPAGAVVLQPKITTVVSKKKSAHNEAKKSLATPNLDEINSSEDNNMDVDSDDGQGAKEEQEEEDEGKSLLLLLDKYSLYF
jgi:hypothetical protein